MLLRRLHAAYRQALSNTIETKIVIAVAGDILDIDPGYRGPKSDKKLHKESEVAEQFPNATVHADLAYKGLPRSEVPHKKPRGGELTPEQKEENRVFSSGRVRVEHSIRRVKGFRIVRDEYRPATGLFGRTYLCVVGLVQLLSLTPSLSNV